MGTVTAIFIGVALIGGAVLLASAGNLGSVEFKEWTPYVTRRIILARAGGAARAKSLTAEQRQEIARKAAAKRWKDRA